MKKLTDRQVAINDIRKDKSINPIIIKILNGKFTKELNKKLGINKLNCK